MASSFAQEFLCNRGEAVRLEAEFPLEFLKRRRGPKGRHSNYATRQADVSLPSERGSLLNRDPRADIGRQDAIAVLLCLVLEDVPGRHGDHAGTDAFSDQPFMSIHRDADLASRGDE